MELGVHWEFLLRCSAYVVPRAADGVSALIAAHLKRALHFGSDVARVHAYEVLVPQPPCTHMRSESLHMVSELGLVSKTFGIFGIAA
jgi:hypothetical protein